MNTHNHTNQSDQTDQHTDNNDMEMYAFDDELAPYFEGNLLLGIHGNGLERPSPIQSKTIVPILKGRDVIAQAQAGSGKTAAYLIPSLAKIDTSHKYPQVIILGNTRPLATQIHYNATQIGVKLIENYGMKIGLCIGGTPNRDSKSSYEDFTDHHMLIGTPGKIISLSNFDKKTKNKLLDKVKLLILDEADILLKNEFALQIQKIVKKIPKTAQICLFSATYPQEVIKLTNQFLINPLKILIENEKISVEGIKNYWVNVFKEDYKYDNLVDIYKKVSVCQAVIFVNSVRKAMQLSSTLTSAGHSVGVLHSDMDEIDRAITLTEFRKTQVRVLVATDLISRGIDVQQVGLVINYDVPHDADSYIHRVGRSGRFGKLGVAITFMVRSSHDIQKMDEIEDKYKIQFEQLRNASDIEKVNNYLTGVKCKTY